MFLRVFLTVAVFASHAYAQNRDVGFEPPPEGLGNGYCGWIAQNGRDDEPGTTIFVCSKDCDRINKKCRDTHPYPADRFAASTFFQLAGRDRRICADDIAEMRHREEFLWYRDKARQGETFTAPFQSYERRKRDFIALAREEIKNFDHWNGGNRNGCIDLDEALKRSAAFYNEYSGDQRGGFFRPSIKTKRPGGVVDEYTPPNQASGSYHAYERDYFSN